MRFLRRTAGRSASRFGPDKNLWFTVAAAAGNKIGRITPEGDVSEYSIGSAASNPRGIADDPDGNLCFTELDGHKIGRITPTGTITECPIPSGASPGDIAPGKDGNLWFTELSANKIGRISDLAGGGKVKASTGGGGSAHRWQDMREPHRPSRQR